jgi:hypothetical protein
MFIQSNYPYVMSVIIETATEMPAQRASLALGLSPSTAPFLFSNGEVDPIHRAKRERRAEVKFRVILDD